MINNSRRPPFATVELVIGFEPDEYQVTDAE